METLQGERDKMKKQYQIQEAEMIALRDQKLEEVKRARYYLYLVILISDKN